MVIRIGKYSNLSLLMIYAQNEAIPLFQTQIPPTIHMRIASNLHGLLTIQGSK